MPARESSGRFPWGIFAVALVGLAGRIGYVLAERNTRISADGFYFHWGGAALADGRGFANPLVLIAGGSEIPAANHPPAWTTTLALFDWIGVDTSLGQQLVACVVGAATVVVIGFVARRLAGFRAGVIAAVIAAVYPNLWLYERELLSEPVVMLLAACTILSAFAFLDDPRPARAALLGALCGLLALTRGEQVFLGVLLLVPLCLWMNGHSWPARVGLLAVAGSLMALVMAPWVLHNMSRFEEPVFLTSNTGEALRISSCDATYYGEYLGYWRRDCSRDKGLVGDPSEKDAVVRERALDYVREHQRRVPIVVLAREGRTWSVFRPLQQMDLDGIRGTDLWVIRLGFVFYWVLAPLAIVGGAMLHRRNVLLTPLLAFPAIAAVATAIVFGQTRYRAAAEVSIVLLAAVAIDALWGRVPRRAAMAPAENRHS